MKPNIIEEKIKIINKAKLETDIKDLKIYRKKLVKYTLIQGIIVAINVDNTLRAISCDNSLIVPSLCLGITGGAFFISLFILAKSNKSIKDKKQELMRLKNSINLIDTVAIEVEECVDSKKYIKRQN